MLMARTYNDNASVAFSSTTAAIASTAFAVWWTANGVRAVRTAAGTKATAFCTALVARKSTSAQKRC
jgi:hypothetical protein